MENEMKTRQNEISKWNMYADQLKAQLADVVRVRISPGSPNCYDIDGNLVKPRWVDGIYLGEGKFSGWSRIQLGNGRIIEADIWRRVITPD